LGVRVIFTRFSLLEIENLLSRVNRLRHRFGIGFQFISWITENLNLGIQDIRIRLQIFEIDVLAGAQLNQRK